MAIGLATTGVAFTAVVVWLTVRIVNRRERWAKWTLAMVVGMPILYVLSFGPACWLADKDAIAAGPAFQSFFAPLAWCCAEADNRAIFKSYLWYGELLSQPEPGADSFSDSTARKLVYLEFIKRQGGEDLPPPPAPEAD